ncbi:ATP-dependent DNA helicase [Salinimicrobium sp. GXAS 041]|uniref:ATP-dependent DNA helicase n=1 Tax=Salinimicrobium sp. GXAS 041 TaxID=3400806 RepID=UPI003C72B7FD
MDTSDKKSILELFPFTPTGDQKNVLIALEEFFTNSTEDFFIINGSAGTGKTLLMSVCISFLGQKEINYNIAAPTGRAARILASKANVPCSTIHSLIYNVATDPEEGTIRFNLKDNESTSYTIFIVDEASMVSSKSISDQESLFEGGNCLLDDLIYFAKQGNDLNKIIFVGDKNQLPPVKEEFSAALSEDFIKNHYNLSGNSYKLQEVKRQDNDSSIYKHIENIKGVIEGKCNDLRTRHFFKENGQVLAEYNYAVDFAEKGHDYCTAIAYSHSKNLQFNRNVRSILFDNPPEKIVPGELLIINRTLKKPEYTLYNGDHVIVKEIDLDSTETIEGLEFVKIILEAKNINNEKFIVKDYILLDTLEEPRGLGKKKEKALHQTRKIQNKKYRENGNAMEDPFLGAIRALYGYSITIHKAQGGEWKKLYISNWYPQSKTYYNSKYTAFTRAIDEVFVYN